MDQQLEKIMHRACCSAFLFVGITLPVTSPAFAEVRDFNVTKDKSHVASQEEIANDPSIVLDAVREGRAARQHLCCGDTQADVIEGCKARSVIGNTKGWASVTWRDEGYSPKLNLPSGASLRLD